MKAIFLSGKTNDQGGPLDATERDRLAKEDPERLRLQLLLGKDRATKALAERDKRAAAEQKRFAALPPADQVLELLSGVITPELHGKIERILKKG